MLSARSLYLCAVANAHLGNDNEVKRLEARAEPLAMSGYGTVLDTPRLLLALHRGDLIAVEALLGSRPSGRRTGSTSPRWRRTWTGWGHSANASGSSKRPYPHSRQERIWSLFALRALGLVREDETLIGQAAERFEAFGLAWHAARTRALV